MQTPLDEKLALLHKELITMGALCEQAIGLVAQALQGEDLDAAGLVRPIEEQIEHKQRDIEGMCLRLLLQQHPVARDLRRITAALHMVTDMERIGDQADDIAEIVGYLGGRACRENQPIAEMARQASEMVSASVDAYVRGDVGQAAAVVERDDVVDALFCSVKTHLIEQIAETPKEGEYALDVLMIAKYFERIADHATNIAEWVEFAATGVYKGVDEIDLLRRG